MSDHRRREYQAADNSYRLILRELGLKSLPERAPSLAEILAADLGIKGPPERRASLAEIVAAAKPKPAPA
jgi:hypothetical protein